VYEPGAVEKFGDQILSTVGVWVKSKEEECVCVRVFVWVVPGG